MIASQPITILLREQNARAIRHVTTTRQNIQSDMINFTDKLMTTLASTCTCCAARGFSDCLLKAPSANENLHGPQAQKDVTNRISGNVEAMYRTPIATKIPDVRLEL